MIQTISKQAIEKATNKSWDWWLQFFERIGASELSHKEIAQAAYDRAGAPGWWAQAVTVAYEQSIGRRQPGQDSDGSFTVSASKTLDGSMDEALRRWQKLVAGRRQFGGIAIAEAPEVSRTDKWRYWRCNFVDGSRAVLTIYQKSPDKAMLGIDHAKLISSEQAEAWRGFWRELLQGVSGQGAA